MSTQEIRLGDCREILADLRNVPAFVADPPANVAFMGRAWDRAHPAKDYVLPCAARSKAHERELRSEEAFVREWASVYSFAYDIADQHAIAILWTLPRTSYQTATALRRAGWSIKDEIEHLFGGGWAKTGNALAPGREGWLVATKGKPDLAIDACRVPRGGEDLARINPGNNALPWGGTFGRGPNTAQTRKEHGLPPLGSLPKNAVITHAEGCIEVRARKVKGSHDGTSKSSASMGYRGNGSAAKEHASHTLPDGSETIPAFHCVAACPNEHGFSVWDPAKPLPRCSACGEMWQWACPAAEINAQSGERPGMSGGGRNVEGYANPTFGGATREAFATPYADHGGAARFFNTFRYLGKSSPSERHAGCEELFWRANKKNPFGFDRVSKKEWDALIETKSEKDLYEGQSKNTKARGNVHPTPKNLELMRWIHRLTGSKRIVDLCAGSCSGGVAAYLDGLDWIGAELCPEAVEIGKARLAWWQGLTPSALAAYLAGEPLPASPVADERQLGLFGG